MRFTEKEYLDLTSRQKLFTEIGKANGLQPPEKEKGKSRKPNKTEQAYMYHLQMEFPHSSVIFSPLALYLQNGHRYTPDIGVRHPDGKILLVEVKNRGYKHSSYGRARLAYDQTALEYGEWFDFRWVEKDQEGWFVR